MLGGNCTHIISSLAGGELRLDAATSMSMSIELSTSAVIKNAGAVDGGSKNESAAVKAPATAAKDDETQSEPTGRWTDTSGNSRGLMGNHTTNQLWHIQHYTSRPTS